MQGCDKYVDNFILADQSAGAVTADKRSIILGVSSVCNDKYPQTQFNNDEQHLHCHLVP